MRYVKLNPAAEVWHHVPVHFTRIPARGEIPARTLCGWIVTEIAIYSDEPGEPCDWCQDVIEDILASLEKTPVDKQ